MSVRSLLGPSRPNLLACSPDDPVMKAVDLIVGESGNAIAVVSASGALAGILTDHDVMRALSAGKGHLGGARVGDWMTRDVVTIAPDASLGEALQQMAQHHIRHLVVAAQDRPLAVIGIRAILAELHKEDALEISVLRDVAIARG
jgi:CBS domain-containing protein